MLGRTLGAAIANHGPIDRWVDHPRFVAGALLAIALGAVAILAAGHRIGWTRLHRVELGVGSALLTLPATTVWSSEPELAVVTPAAVLVMIGPMVVAVLQRAHHFDHRARIAFVVSVALGAAVLAWSEFGTGDWNNHNEWRPAYVLYLAVAWGLVVGLWSLAWYVGWGAPGTRGLVRLWGGETGEAPLIEPSHDHRRREDDRGHAHVQPHAPAPIAHTSETLVHARRIRVLGLFAFLTGVAMIPTVVLAVPGIAVMAVSTLVLRAAQTPSRRAGPWPQWAAPVLVGTLVAALVVTAAIVRWVTADDLEAGWAAVLALGAIAWTAAFGFAVVAARVEVLGDR